MQIYMAAVYSNSYMPGMNRYVKLNERERGIVESIPNILESWHYVGKQSFVDHMRANGAKIFLDSGAFSAFTLGVDLSVAEYCDYIARNMDIIRFEDGAMMASVLDGIGDAQQTWRNQNEMEIRFKHMGLDVRPLPCFHFEEDSRYLDYYVANYEYITLGGMVGASTQQLRNWLERVWENHLLDGSGRAKIKVHGFGITSVPLMEEFDWYSCDSSSWIQSAAFGSVVMPGESRKNAGWTLSVSEKSPSRHVAGQHATTMSPPEIEYIFNLLETYGFTYDRLSSIYESRAAYNLWSFPEIENILNRERRDDYRAQKQMDLYGTLG
jgi:hypothetical protein